MFIELILASSVVCLVCIEVTTVCKVCKSTLVASLFSKAVILVPWLAIVVSSAPTSDIKAFKEDVKVLISDVFVLT